MMKPADAERITGYRIGGIGPFGQKRRVATAFDETAELHDRIFVNAGQRGLLLSLSPSDAIRAAAARLADLCA
jgi:Cys-tRNA(Pro)/Cys-tRNA(Cys) deacylase